MAIDDVLKRVAAEQAAKQQQESAAKKAAEEAKAREDRKLADLEKVKATQKDAARLRKEKARLEGIVKELATGQYEEGSRGYMTLLGEATKLDNSIKALETKLNYKSPEAPKVDTTVNKAAAVEIPFGGTPKPLTSVTAAQEEVTTPKKKTPTKTDTTGKTVSGSFDVGSFRKADEASMAAVEGAPTSTTGNRTLESILGDVQNYFDLPDYIFKLDDDLGKLLVKAVNEKWTTERWDKEIENTNWWRKNSSQVRTRLANFGNYSDLRSQGQDVSKSDYGLWLSKKKGQLKADAQAIAGVALSDAQADQIAQKIYLGFLDDDENAIRSFLVPLIGKTNSIVGGKTISGYSGKALQDYQTLQSIAKANGFSLKDILPNISTSTTGGDLEEAVLEQIALGTIDVNRISQDARNLAAIGQPEFVRGLLGQGYDLDQIYSPYKNIMSKVLEIDPNQIDLNDPTLRSAISDKGETNLYDFQRALRKDSRWQYTQGAREEVGDVTLKVLRDFGFQG